MVERGPGGEARPTPPVVFPPPPAYMTQRWDVADARSSGGLEPLVAALAAAAVPVVVVTGHRPAGKYTYHRVNLRRWQRHPAEGTGP